MLNDWREKGVRRFGAAWRSWSADALLRRLISNASMLLGGKAVNAFFSLGFLALAARGLSLEAFGTLILIHTYTQAIGDFTKFQSWQAVLTYGTPAWNEGRIGDLQKILKFSLRLDVIGALAGLVIAFLGLPLAQHLFDWSSATTKLASYYVISVLFLDIASTTGVLRLFDRFDLSAVQSSIGALIKLLGAAAAFYLGAGLEAYLAAWFAAAIIPCLVLICMALFELRRQGVLAPQTGDAGAARASWKPDRKVWGFVWSSNLNTSLQLVLTHFGTLAVGALLGAPAAALYRVARQLTEAITTPVKLLTPTIYPELARLAARNAMSEMRRFMLRAALLAGSMASLLSVVLIVAGPWLLLIVAGEKFTGAYMVMAVLAGAAAVRLGSFPLEPMLISSGQALAALRVRILTTVLYIALMFFLCPIWGLVGAGLSLLIATLANLIGQLVVVEKWLRQQAGTT